MENLRILILAAGKGTRMKSRKAKVLHQVGGASLLEQVLRTARSVSPAIDVVIGHQAQTIRELLPEVAFVEQTQQLGTGHAVLAARGALGGFEGELLVLPGDVPLIGEKTLRDFVAFHREGGFKASVLTAEVENAEGYGRIVRGPGRGVDAIVEHRDASVSIREIREINSSIYLFHTPALFDALAEVGNENAQGEYYLTDVIGILTRSRAPVGAWKAPSAEEVLGINTRQELAAMDKILRLRKCTELMAAGVTVVDPASTYIDLDVEIGPDSIIYPSVQISGRTSIEEDVTIRSFTRISDCRIGARTTILEGCILESSTVGNDVSLGPYSRLRPETTLHDKVKVGNFVEMKKSTMGRGSKAMHLSYVGDATVGTNVNIGAGVITVNYDGSKKYPTHIEDEAFIGSDSTLIAPVRVEKGAFVAAGSTITDDVPPEALAIARGRQVVKDGRAPHRKKK